MILTRCMKNKLNKIVQDVTAHPDFLKMDFFSLSINGHGTGDYTETFLVWTDASISQVKEIEEYLRVQPGFNNKYMAMRWWHLVPFMKDVNNVYLNAIKN